MADERLLSAVDIKTSSRYALKMRTTLTLDDDVARQIEALRRSRGAKWKTLINEALRLGLVQMQKKVETSQAPPTQPKSLGRCLVGNIVSISEVLALAEGDAFH